jgi:hypothetical protein
LADAVTLLQVREEIAATVSALTGLPAFGGWRGMIEPNTARVVPARDGWIYPQGPAATMAAPEVAWTVVLIANGTDLQGAEDALMLWAAALCTGLGGQLLASGNTAPPVLEVTAPAGFSTPSSQDISHLLALECQLAAFPLTL